MVGDEEKSQEQLFAEVRALRERVAALEIVEAERRQAEEDLRIAKEYAETLINSSLDMIIAVDQDRRIVEFNRAAEKTFGYDKAEVLGQPVDVLYADPTQGLAIHSKTMETGGVAAEISNKRKNGEVFDAYLEASVLQGADGTLIGVMGISRDISEHKRAREEQARLTAILDATPDFVGIADINGRALYINRAGRKMVGMSGDEPAANMLISDYHPEWVRIRLSEILPIVMREGVWSGETALLTRDGREIPVSQVILAHKAPDGTVEFFPTIMRDISERKRAEDALRDSEERYRGLFENANDAIATFTLDAIITSVNRGAERMLGWSREELIGQHVSKVASPASVALASERTRRFLAGEKLPSSMFEVELIHKDGHIIPVEARTRAIRDRTGTPIGFQGNYRDVSAKKSLERQREDFLAMLAHDIRNPLAAILGYVDLLQRAAGEQSSSFEKEFVQRVRDNAMSIHSLITNYLDLARAEAGKLVLLKTPQAVDNILRRVVQQYAGVAQRHHLTLTLELAEELPSLLADGMALERTFSNLVRNALQFTPETGQITVRARRWGNQKEREAATSLASASPPYEGGIVVEVTDTGPGIAPEEIPLLFQKYRRPTLTRNHDGTGLGLFIVKTFVEAHGGRVEVDSVLGSGACFRIILPASS